MKNIIIKYTLKRILYRLMLPLQFWRRQNARCALTLLKQHKNLTIRLIGFAVEESLNKILSLHEQRLISLIEQRRSFLLKSDKSITVVDYGAGSSSTTRTRQEMDKGVHLIDRVSKITAASKPKFWATILFKVVRKLEPLSCVELGTCVGISASYLAYAQKINGQGAVVTLEGSDEIANLAMETFANLQIENACVVRGPFHETLNGVFESSKPIDFFFNDGHHDHDAVIRYFNQVIPYLSDAAIIVFDDISWSPGMRKAWIEIENDQRVSASIDLHTMGIVLIDKAMDTKEKFRIPL